MPIQLQSRRDEVPKGSIVFNRWIAAKKRLQASPRSASMSLRGTHESWIGSIAAHERTRTGQRRVLQSKQNFADLGRRPRWFVPLLLVVLATVAYVIRCPST